MEENFRLIKNTYTVRLNYPIAIWMANRMMKIIHNETYSVKMLE